MMAEIKTDYIEKCLSSLELANQHLQSYKSTDDMYDIFRAACTKEFELILEQAGKLLLKILRPYFATKKEVDQLTFKDSFRYATKHGILTPEESERWLNYRDNRNETTHDYGDYLADRIILILPEFINDAKNFVKAVQKQNESKT